MGKTGRRYLILIFKFELVVTGSKPSPYRSVQSLTLGPVRRLRHMKNTKTNLPSMKERSAS